MLFMGFWKVIVGTTLGHEGHHGSVSKRPWVNQLYRMGFNLNGETTLHWIQYHLGRYNLHNTSILIQITLWDVHSVVNFLYMFRRPLG